MFDAGVSGMINIVNVEQYELSSNLIRHDTSMSKCKGPCIMLVACRQRSYGWGMKQNFKLEGKIKIRTLSVSPLRFETLKWVLQSHSVSVSMPSDPVKMNDR